MPLVFYVMVRGPLGSGKTSVARRVADAVPGRYISVDHILEEHHLEQWEGDFISERSFLEANRFVVQEAEPALRRGAPSVVDGNFYWRSVIEDLTARLRYPHAVVTLRVPLAVCIARDSGREVPLGPENTKMVFDKATSFEYGEPIDARGSVEETTALLLQELRRRNLI